MKPETKKWIIVGVLGAVSIALAIGYIQYKKLMNYAIKFKGAKIKKLSATLFDFDLFINFTNNSDIKFEILEQDYKVYVNEKFVTKLVNYTQTPIAPKSTSVIPVNVQFDPQSVLKTLGKNIVGILSKPETINVMVDVKLKVKLYGFKISIPYVYKATLKEMMTPAPK